VEVEVPPGRYLVYATAGPFATLARHEVNLQGGQHQSLSFALDRLDLQPEGTLSADLHLHSGRSYDTTFPERDRVVSILASDVNVVAVTEHDLTHDFSTVIEELGARERFAVMPGSEATGYILWLDVPGSLIPKVVGHWNFWPLTYHPDQPRGGVPWSQLAEPGELFERMLPAYSATPVIQLNHPWEGDMAGRDQGWARALKFDLNRPLPYQPDGTAMGLFARTPRCGPEPAMGCTWVNTPNHAYHIQEVWNGTPAKRYVQERAFWFYLLDQGVVRPGTANSDSHYLVDSLVGSPRNMVFTSTTVGDFQPDAFNQALREGRSFGTNGPVLLVAVTDGQAGHFRPSTTPIMPGDEGRLQIEVSAAPWVPVEEIRIYVNGALKRTVTEGIDHPADPFGAQGVVRYSGWLSLAELLPAGNRDAYLTVEAGTQLPLFADLTGDGVPETTDNNADGRVDEMDVDEEDRDDCKPGAGAGSCGPLKGPPHPEDESDPRFHFHAVTPGAYPLAFTNPLLLDRDGNGLFAGPGLGGE
jgi:hypothetical protein